MKENANSNDGLREFQFMIEDLGIRHFDASEVWVPMMRPPNAPPPRCMWGNILPTLLVADQLREEIGHPLWISSSGRTATYNSTLPGHSPVSRHLVFDALDLHPVGVSTDSLYRLAKKVRDARRIDMPTHFSFQKFCRPDWYAQPTKTILGDKIHTSGEVVDNHFFWYGGVGVYDTFIHIDTRGVDTDWAG